MFLSAFILNHSYSFDTMQLSQLLTNSLVVALVVVVVVAKYNT